MGFGVTSGRDQQEHQPHLVRSVGGAFGRDAKNTDPLIKSASMRMWDANTITHKSGVHLFSREQISQDLFSVDVRSRGNQSIHQLVQNGINPIRLQWAEPLREKGLAEVVRFSNQVQSQLWHAFRRGQIHNTVVGRSHSVHPSAMFVGIDHELGIAAFHLCRDETGTRQALRKTTAAVGFLSAPSPDIWFAKHVGPDVAKADIQILIVGERQEIAEASKVCTFRQFRAPGILLDGLQPFCFRFSNGSFVLIDQQNRNFCLVGRKVSDASSQAVRADNDPSFGVLASESKQSSQGTCGGRLQQDRGQNHRPSERLNKADIVRIGSFQSQGKQRRQRRGDDAAWGNPSQECPLVPSQIAAPSAKHNGQRPGNEHHGQHREQTAQAKGFESFEVQTPGEQNEQRANQQEDNFFFECPEVAQPFRTLEAKGVAGHGRGQNSRFAANGLSHREDAHRHGEGEDVGEVGWYQISAVQPQQDASTNDANDGSTQNANHQINNRGESAGFIRYGDFKAQQGHKNTNGVDDHPFPVQDAVQSFVEPDPFQQRPNDGGSCDHDQRRAEQRFPPRSIGQEDQSQSSHQERDEDADGQQPGNDHWGFSKYAAIEGQPTLKKNESHRKGHQNLESSSQVCGVDQCGLSQDARTNQNPCGSQQQNGGKPNTPRDGDQWNPRRESQANAKQHVVNVGIRLCHPESLRVRPMIDAMSLLLSTWSFSRPEHESAFARLGPGTDPLDAAMHVADAVEADPEVDSVGYGGLPDASGGISLDALVMRSPAEHGSAIALTKVRQAAAAARLVMEKSPHRIIAGPGADAFAMQHGLPEEELLAPAARERWEAWRDDPQQDPGQRPWDSGLGRLYRTEGGHDTVCVLAQNDQGVAGVCTTSGMPWKTPGRVGDSPIPGAGLYVHPRYGAATITGTGELVIGNCASFSVVESMRQGADPSRAIAHLLELVLAEQPVKPEDQLGVIAIGPDGHWAAGSLRPGFKYVVTDKQGTRVESPELVIVDEPVPETAS